MNHELLKQAQAALHIQDVSQRSASAHLADGYDPKYNSLNLEVQSMHQVLRSEVLEPSEGIDLPRLFRVHVYLAVRWFDSSFQEGELQAPGPSQSKESPPPSEDSVDVLGRIDTNYVAEYQLLSNPAQEVLDEFALKNVSYHVWPYFREFVTSQSARMNVPKIVLPMFQPACNQAWNEQEAEGTSEAP